MNSEIKNSMSTHPQTVNKDCSLKVAISMMSAKKVRHLPVLEAGKLVGVLSDRDAKWAMTFGLPEKLSIEEIMTQDPYVVSESDDVRTAIATMLERKLGCVVVQNNSGAITGIFTRSDAMKWLLPFAKNLK